MCIPRQRKALFKDWFLNGEDFQVVLVNHQRQVRNETAVATTYVYKTRAELDVEFGEQAATAIIKGKVKSGHWRRHPELPSDPQFFQYWMNSGCTMTQSNSTATTTQLNFEAEVDNQSAKDLHAAFNPAEMMPAVPGLDGVAGLMDEEKGESPEDKKKDHSRAGGRGGGGGVEEGEFPVEAPPSQRSPKMRSPRRATA